MCCLSYAVFFCSYSAQTPHPTRFPYTTLFRSDSSDNNSGERLLDFGTDAGGNRHGKETDGIGDGGGKHRSESFGACHRQDRKSTRLNSSHVKISYAVFCLKKKKQHRTTFASYH